MQKGLRKQKLGEMLVTQQIVGARSRCSRRSSASKDAARSGSRRCSRSAWIDERQLKEALVQQQLDRRRPAARRDPGPDGRGLAQQLATTLARKMGSPLVNLEAFPVEPRRCASSATASRRACARAAADPRRPPRRHPRRPSRRARRRRDRVHSQLKVVPVLGRSIYTPLHAAYDKIGSGARRAWSPTWRRRSPTSRLLRRLHGPAEDDRRARRDASKRRPSD